LRPKKAAHKHQESNLIKDLKSIGDQVDQLKTNVTNTDAFAQAVKKINDAILRIKRPVSDEVYPACCSCGGKTVPPANLSCNHIQCGKCLVEELKRVSQLIGGPYIIKCMVPECGYFLTFNEIADYVDEQTKSKLNAPPSDKCNICGNQAMELLELHPAAKHLLCKLCLKNLIEKKVNGEIFIIVNSKAVPNKIKCPFLKCEQEISSATYLQCFSNEEQKYYTEYAYELAGKEP
jgi:hypothetical protein